MNKLFILLAFLIISTSARAAETAIVATVGDNAITTQDLINRTRLIIISTGLKADDETARKIAPQILQSLINERLELQEADKQQITISDDEINKAIVGIEEQNKMAPGQLKIILKKTEIPYSTLQSQVKAQIAWVKIRSKKIQPKITVSDEAVDDFIKTENMNPTQTEYYVNEIVLPVETQKDDGRIHELANKLASELDKGADFKKIAKQFSQASSSQNGGDVGWLAENQIPKELLSEVQKIGLNKIIGPVKSIEGYFILLVSQSRNIDTKALDDVITLKHFEIAYSSPKDQEATNQKLLAINDPIKGCKDSQDYANSVGATMQDYGSIQVKELQPAVRKIVVDLPTGRYSPPVDSGDSWLTFLVCTRADKANIPTDVQRDKAREILFHRKMELEARAYLRDLRRNTNIDVKL